MLYEYCSRCNPVYFNNVSVLFQAYEVMAIRKNDVLSDWGVKIIFNGYGAIGTVGF